MAGTHVVLTANTQATLSEDDLQCPICVSLLKEPKSLICGHSFCADCLKDYCRSSQFRTYIRCPVCRQETFCVSTVDRLPTNYAVLACIEKIEAASRKPQSLSSVLHSSSATNQMDVDDSSEASERVQTAAQHFASPRRRPYLVSCTELVSSAALRLESDRRDPLVSGLCVSEYTHRLFILDYANYSVKSIPCDLLATGNKSVTQPADKQQSKAETKSKSTVDLKTTNSNSDVEQSGPKRTRRNLEEDETAQRSAVDLRCELRCVVGAPCAVRVLDTDRIVLVERMTNCPTRQLVFYGKPTTNFDSRASSRSEDGNEPTYVPVQSIFLCEGASPLAYIELTYNAHLLVAFEGSRTVFEFDSRLQKVAHLRVQSDEQAQSTEGAVSEQDNESTLKNFYLSRKISLPVTVNSLTTNRELDLITVSCSGSTTSSSANPNGQKDKSAVRLYDRNFVQLLRVDAKNAEVDSSRQRSVGASSSTSSATSATPPNASSWRPTRALLNTDSFLFVHDAARKSIDCYELETFEYSHVLVENVHVSVWCLNASETTLIVYDGSSKRAILAYTMKYSTPKTSKKASSTKRFSSSDEESKANKSRRCVVM